jgi:hypothetical protein
MRAFIGVAEAGSFSAVWTRWILNPLRSSPEWDFGNRAVDVEPTFFGGWRN